MRTGKLSISRGPRRGDSPPSGPRLTIVPNAEPAATVPAAVSPEYRPVHDRLTALERLAKLHEEGALTDEEFTAEKTAILGRDPDELVLNEPLIGSEPAVGPTLFGRLFGWKILPVGLAAGLALSYASQPRETVRFFEGALSLFGA